MWQAQSFKQSQKRWRVLFIVWARNGIRLWWRLSPRLSGQGDNLRTAKNNSNKKIWLQTELDPAAPQLIPVSPCCTSKIVCGEPISPSPSQLMKQCVLHWIWTQWTMSFIFYFNLVPSLWLQRDWDYYESFFLFSHLLCLLYWPWQYFTSKLAFHSSQPSAHWKAAFLYVVHILLLLIISGNNAPDRCPAQNSFPSEVRHGIFATAFTRQQRAVLGEGEPTEWKRPTAFSLRFITGHSIWLLIPLRLSPMDFPVESRLHHSFSSPSWWVHAHRD